MFTDTCTLPEGCQVFLPFYVTHRSSRHWNNPDKFIPERFTTEEIALRHPYAYVPFSGGLMGCIGTVIIVLYFPFIMTFFFRSPCFSRSEIRDDVFETDRRERGDELQNRSNDQDGRHRTEVRYFRTKCQRVQIVSWNSAIVIKINKN